MYLNKTICQRQEYPVILKGGEESMYHKMNFHGGKKSDKFEDKLGSHFLVRLNKKVGPAVRAGGWACAAGSQKNKACLKHPGTVWD